MRASIIGLSAAVLSSLSFAALSASPAGAALTDEGTSLEWTGGGPYVLPNVTGESGTPVCDPAALPLCDKFTLTVDLSDEFRAKEENQRQTVVIGISFDTTLPVDYDLWVEDSAGKVLGEGTGSFGDQETVGVPLKTLKNGDYTVIVVPYFAAGTNYAGYARVGSKAPAAAGLRISPQVGTAPLTAQFDARSLAPAPSGGWVFDFGDGSAPVADADGVLEHTYEQNGQYLARVRSADGQGAKGVVSRAEVVYVGDIATGKSGSGIGGAFGAFGLLAALGLALRRGRAR